MQQSQVWYIGFFRYEDTKTWNRSSLYLDKKDLETYLNSLTYVDKASITITEVSLPK